MARFASVGPSVVRHDVIQPPLHMDTVRHNCCGLLVLFAKTTIFGVGHSSVRDLLHDLGNCRVLQEGGHVGILDAEQVRLPVPLRTRRDPGNQSVRHALQVPVPRERQFGHPYKVVPGHPAVDRGSLLANRRAKRTPPRAETRDEVFKSLAHEVLKPTHEVVLSVWLSTLARCPPCCFRALQSAQPQCRSSSPRLELLTKVSGHAVRPRKDLGPRQRRTPTPTKSVTQALGRPRNREMVERIVDLQLGLRGGDKLAALQLDDSRSRYSGRVCSSVCPHAPRRPVLHDEAPRRDERGREALALKGPRAHFLS
mmetsp:Transcript_5896/g.21128  ORF Transcript_5896/g.21128 Transcript_5896/m.21128 type:complete len:311 (+) Transcript_5896:136-1068(+)